MSFKVINGDKLKTSVVAIMEPKKPFESTANSSTT